MTHHRVDSSCNMESMDVEPVYPPTALLLISTTKPDIGSAVKCNLLFRLLLLVTLKARLGLQRDYCPWHCAESDRR